MVNGKFETVREPGKFGNHAASRIYYVHGRFVRKKKEVILKKRLQQKPMWPRSVCTKQVSVSPHIYSCCKKSNNEKYKVCSKKRAKKTSGFKKVHMMYTPTQ